MSIPSTITAVVQRHGGYNPEPEGHILFDSFEPYVELREIDTPELGSEQVLVEMTMAAVNPSDLHFLKGEYGQPRQLGKPAGFEGVGTVIASGSDAYAASLVGQRVSFVATPTGSGTWATHAVTEAMLCIPMPDTVADPDAAGFIVNPLTAAAMFEQAKGSGSGAVILTAGASQVSKFIIALARDAGLASIAVVRRDVHNDALRELGATDVLDLSQEDFAARLSEVVSEYKPATLIDAVVDARSTEIFNAMGRGSTWLVYGSLSPDTPPICDPGGLIFQNKMIRGFWLTPWMSSTSLEDKLAVFGKVQARFGDGRWSTDVSATVGLDQVVASLAGALADPRGKVFVTP